MFAPTPRRSLTVPILWTTVAWFTAVLLAGLAGVFDTAGVPVAIGIAAAIPPLLVIGLLIWSPRFQEWTRSLDLRLLITLHMWRLVGFGFLATWAVGALPGSFALSAGYGDIMVGVTAPFVAFACLDKGRRGKAAFYSWTAFGVADLLLAVLLGVLHSDSPLGILAEGPGSGVDILGPLPMSIIPTFVVPLMLSLHAMSVYVARHHQWVSAAAFTPVDTGEVGAGTFRSREEDRAAVGR